MMATPTTAAASASKRQKKEAEGAKMDDDDEEKEEEGNNSKALNPLITNFDARASAFITSWLTIENMLQHRLASTALPRNSAEEMCCASALVLCLAPIPIQSTITAAQTSAAEGTGQMSARATFLVLRMLSSGWSSVYETEAQALAAAAMKKGAGSKGGAKNAGPKEKLSRFFGGEHMLIHSYQLIKRGGGYLMGPRTENYLVVSPGMLFTLKTWGSKIENVFKLQKEDVQPFDIAIVQLALKSSDSKKTDEMLELRSFKVLEGASAAAKALVPPSILPASLQAKPKYSFYFYKVQ